MGTKAALEDAVGIIHGGTTVQENWEYGGQPYFFRVAVDAGQEKVAENPVGRLLDTSGNLTVSGTVSAANI